MLPLLLRPKVLSFRNSLTTSFLMKRLPFSVAGLGLCVLSYYGTYTVLSYVRAMDFAGEIVADKLFSMTFFALTGFLVLSNIITALSSFYLSRDILFLLTKPVGVGEILGLKTAESILNSSWMVMVFVPPVFIAYGTSYHASLPYYVFMAAALLMFIFITGGIGIASAHVLARIFPAKRSRDVLLGAGLMLLLVLYFVVKAVMPRGMSSPEEIMKSFISFRSESPFLPGYWIEKTALPLLRGGEADLFYSLLLLSNSMFFPVLSSIVGARFYRDNIERILPSPARRGALGKYYPPSGRAVFYKDAITFFRDVGQWSQVFIIFALIIVYIYNFKSIPVDALSAVTPLIREIMVLVNMVMAGLVLSAVSARFLYTSVSLEGQAFWIVRTSPVSLRRFLYSKLTYGSIPLTLMIAALIFFTNSAMGVRGQLMLISLATAVLLGISISGLGTGLGAVYPKFEYENIASVSISIGGMVFMVLAFLVVLVTVALESWIYYLSVMKTTGLDATDKTKVALGITLILVVNAIAFYLPMKMGEKSLKAG